MEPTEEQREQLARRFFGGGLREQHLTWKNLTEPERENLLKEFRQQGPSPDELARAAEVDRRMANAGKQSDVAKGLFAAMQGYVQRGMQDLIKKLPQLLEKDLSGIVQKAIHLEVGFIQRRQEILTAAADERITRLSERLDQHKAFDAKSRFAVHEQWVNELQAQVCVLQQEVAELKRR